jgi:hypothetical protein
LWKSERLLRHVIGFLGSKAMKHFSRIQAKLKKNGNPKISEGQQRCSKLFFLLFVYLQKDTSKKLFNAME